MRAARRERVKVGFAELAAHLAEDAVEFGVGGGSFGGGAVFRAERGPVDAVEFRVVMFFRDELLDGVEDLDIERVAIGRGERRGLDVSGGAADAAAQEQGGEEDTGKFGA